MADPRYRQIAEDLRQKIESGELGHGAQLPTELELREQYDASRNTVRDAIRLLTTRGLVETRPGQGTFVVDKIDPFLAILTAETGFGAEHVAKYAYDPEARNRKLTQSVPRVEIHLADDSIARELQLPVGTPVVSRHQRRFIDGTPWSLQTTYYPMSYVDDGARGILEATDMTTGVVRYLEETLGIKQVGWRDRIAVRASNADEVSLLNLPSDGRVAVFEIYRTAFERSGKPLRLTITVYPADRNQFVMITGEIP